MRMQTKKRISSRKLISWWQVVLAVIFFGGVAVIVSLRFGGLDPNALDLSLLQHDPTVVDMSGELQHEDVDPPQHQEIDTAAATLATTSLRDDLLVVAAPEVVWTDLLAEWTEGAGIAMEVGMHRPLQCIQAARAGLHAHCFEPSPPSFRIVEGRVEAIIKEDDVKSHIHLYNQAAGAVSGIEVPFSAGGSTGDHVGSFDMWKMEEPEEDQSGNMVNVKTVRLDEVIEKEEETVYIAKIDTQGFEPSVLEGLSDSIRGRKIKFLLMEYWPKGIDLLAEAMGECKAVNMLQDLVESGYTLYALGVSGHPHADKGGWKEDIRVNVRPLDSLKAHCQWFYQVEERNPVSDYFMGYWTDILAVSPTASLDHEPTTRTGLILFGRD